MIPRVLILTGSTASGKSDLAFELAASSPKIEIISCDSVQVYRHFNIGSAKPTSEELTRVRHHLVDIRNPNEEFTAGDFVKETKFAIDHIRERGGIPLIVGGTPFYLKALILGMWDACEPNPEYRKTLEPLSTAELYHELVKKDPTTKTTVTDRYRVIRALEIIELTGQSVETLKTNHQRKLHENPPAEQWQVIQVSRVAAELAERIKLRSQKMIEAGLIEETKQLASQYPNARALSSVGYAQVLDYLHGRKPEGREMRPGSAGLVDEITLATRQLAKRQNTFFRGLQAQIPLSQINPDQDREKFWTEATPFVSD